MKYTITLFLILFVSSFAVADETTQAVNDYCTCAKPAFEKHREIMEVFKKHMSDPKKAEESLKEIEKGTESLAKCFENLNEKYKNQQTNEEFQKKVNAGIQKQCPKPQMNPMKMKS